MSETESNNERFYSRLPVNEIPITELLMEDHLFYKLPSDWMIVLTDIKGSTDAIQDGSHQTVNLVATGSIVAVLNIAFKADLTIPFFFGGDGATFILPPGIFPTSISALNIHKENTAKDFGLHLRVGCIPISEIYRNGLEFRISKFRSGPSLVIPIVLGNGMEFAERIIKSEETTTQIPDLPNTELDLSGMQCRWSKIAAPKDDYEIVCLLVVAAAGASQTRVFRKVLEQVDSIYGPEVQRKPVSIAKLRLTTAISRIGLEMRTRFSKNKPLFLIAQWIRTLLGRFYFKTRPGLNYLHRLVEMTDTLVIDGRINTVISGSREQRLRLEKFLTESESMGELVYGLHVSQESVMSCYVINLNDKHIHFVDGSGGGYTHAAKMIKKKLLEKKLQEKTGIGNSVIETLNTRGNTLN